MMADLLLEVMGHEAFTLSSKNLTDAGETRRKYSETLRKADNQDYEQLAVFFEVAQILLIVLKEAPMIWQEGLEYRILVMKNLSVAAGNNASNVDLKIFAKAWHSSRILKKYVSIYTQEFMGGF